MKRPRLALDKQAIGGFALAHCEKFVVAILGLVALWFAWNGFAALRLKSAGGDRTPDAVAQLARKAVGHIDASQKPPAEIGRRPGGVVAAIDPWRPGADSIAPPPEMALLDRPLVQELAKRSKPDILPIEDLRAVAGVAVLPDLTPAGSVPQPRSADRDAQPPEQPKARPGSRPRPGRRGEEQPSPSGEPGSQSVPEVPGPTAERGRVVPYVVVTGLVPAARQLAEYQRAFASAGYQEAQRDRPFWSGYKVERAAVGSDGAASRWESMALRNVETFGGMGAAPVAAPADQQAEPLQPEMLPAAFLLGSEETDVGYAAQLPQRVDEPWGLEAVHPWVAARYRKLLEESAPDTATDAPAAAVEPRRLAEDPAGFDGRTCSLADMKFVGDPRREGDLVAFPISTVDGAVAFPVDTLGSGTQPVFVVSAAWARMLAIDDGPRRDTPCTLRVRLERFAGFPLARILGITYRPVDGQAEEELADPLPIPLAAAAGYGDGAGGAEGAEFRLFRFVDTTVKPGQRYRYRVKVSVRNPNAGIDRQYLADPATAVGDVLAAKASAESPPVTVPDANRLLARTLTREDVKQRKLKPGTLEVLVLAPSSTTGGYSLRSLITEVGGLANVDSGLNRPGDARAKGEDVSTGRVLVDVRGRQEDSGKAAAETFEMFFVRPDGGVEVVSAADSQRFCDRYLSTLDPPSTTAGEYGLGQAPGETAQPRRGPNR